MKYTICLIASNICDHEKKPRCRHRTTTSAIENALSPQTRIFRCIYKLENGPELKQDVPIFPIISSRAWSTSIPEKFAGLFYDGLRSLLRTTTCRGRQQAGNESEKHVRTGRQTRHEWPYYIQHSRRSTQKRPTWLLMEVLLPSVDFLDSTIVFGEGGRGRDLPVGGVEGVVVFEFFLGGFSIGCSVVDGR